MQSIHGSVFATTGVQMYGHVTIGEGSSVWPNAVIRAGVDPRGRSSETPRGSRESPIDRTLAI